jgi:hypothetical protein
MMLDAHCGQIRASLPMIVLDRNGFDPFDDVWVAVHRQQVVLPADLYVAGRQDDVPLLEGSAYIGRRQAACIERPPIEVRHDARLGLIWLGDVCSMDDGQVRANDVLAKIVEHGIRVERLSWMTGTSAAP